MGASSAGPIFLKSINSSGVVKDGGYIAKLFIKVIEDVDPKNVVQVITDNTGNMKLAGTIVEETFPHIFWTPCIVHCLNLSLKSMCQPSKKLAHFTSCAWILKEIGYVSSLKNFVVNHDMAHAIFQKHLELSLLKVAETRFASHIVMTSRVYKVKFSLEKMVMDDEWKNYKGDKVLEAREREIKSLVMDDEWWDKVEYFLKCTELIISMLRRADLDISQLHLIYDMCDTMIEKVKLIVFEHEGKDLINGQSEFFDTIQEILVARWNKSDTPLHCLSHFLVPKYYHESWLQGEDNGIRRLAPNEDREIVSNRIKCFQRYFKNPNDLKQVSLEYGAFCSLSGGDHFNIDESVNELVELSIDEPQLEGVFFENEVENLEEDDSMEEIEEDDL
ncbi:hypothetical protein CQW23_19368 [Capsicum baccatum]|uniref:DUF659 domain-containing protein n=1 Tax=Capsicum baccatum TaxID=33114 RepID=A0A2G2W5M6_CAPBA|nr:hypothetical protein CQW23_19368 [Capsicum baccatum]